MKITKSMLVAGLVTTATAASVIGIGAASAQSNNSNGTGLIDKIATTFNLKRDSVQSTFDQFREEKQADRQVKADEHLQSLVDNGTITADQKAVLEAKKDEQKAAFENLKSQDLTRQEMHDQMEALHDDFTTWAEQQGINLQDIRPDKGVDGDHRGPRGHFGPRGMMDGPEGPADTDIR